MEYQITAKSISGKEGTIFVKQSTIDFGTIQETEGNLPNPAELFLGAFASCILKNVERFSEMMKFNYNKAVLTVDAVRLDSPPRMEHLSYELILYGTDDKLNIDLLKKNIEKFGTIYNTVKQCCSITGKITKQTNV